MTIPTFNRCDPVIKIVWLALLCAILTHHYSSSRSELYSETLCWMILPILFKVTSHADVNTLSKEDLTVNYRRRTTSSSTLWLLAGCITTACVYKTENNIIVLFPVLTPLILIAERHIQFEVDAEQTLKSSIVRPHVNTIWSNILVASCIILTLSNCNTRRSVFSIVPTAALLVVYLALIPRPVKYSRFLPAVDIEHDIGPLSMRVTIVLISALGIEAIAIGPSTTSVAPTLMLGLAKAFSWYLMALMTRYTSWCVATGLGTFSLTSTYDPFRSSSEVQALLYVVASFLALGQIIHAIPKQTRARTTLWACSIFFLLPYLANVLAIRHARSSAQHSFDNSQEHPVEALIKRAEADFESLLRKQSQNYTAACGEYHRRYGMNPPPGFEAWYEFATLHQSPIIDDFNMIYNNVSPFWRLSGNEVLQIMRLVENTPESELWLCTVSGHQVKTHCRHHHRRFDRHIQRLFESLVGEVRGDLPDLKVLVNHLDEPRVLFPPQPMEVKHHGHRLLNVTNMSRQPVWDSITRSCPAPESRRGAGIKDPVATFGLPFVTDAFAAMSLCRHSEYSALHGLFMRPMSFRLLEGLVPILSTGSLSTMDDIIYPSPAYAEAEFQYVDIHDVEWDNKRNNLYWAGSTTGGFVSDDKWRQYHRQRFVKLGQNMEKQKHDYLRQRNGVISRVKSSFLNSRSFDVAFTKVFQCKRRFCRDQRAFFTVKPWADKDQALRSRLVFDLDGNGISGRYNKLLSSKSVPLKQTLLREWHDERLVPWLHYIPVSQGMEELPELVSYLTSTRRGQRRAKEVAQHGRDWSSKALREIDRKIYTYRLLLELARLQDPERRPDGR